MNSKIALLIIYNHRFDGNIPRLNAIYNGKFSNIYHIMPFYDGSVENVITVYDSSYYFESYIAQAYQKIKDLGYTHYFFVADDMILNPQIDENNLFEFTGISKDCSWINDLRDYTTHPHCLPVCIPLKKKGIEVDRFLPSFDDACRAFDRKSLKYFPSLSYAFFDLINSFFRKWGSSCLKDLHYIFNRKKKDYYPCVWGYSDVLLVPSTYMPSFAQYCGAFAGLNVFVEHAIPLALLLSSNKLMTQADINLKTITQLYGLGPKGQKEFEEFYAFDLNKLQNEFPDNTFFIHPVKLSKWK